MKPMILLSPRHRIDDDHTFYYNYTSYYDYIHQAGGLAFQCGIESKQEIVQMVEQFDGLLLTGGLDIDPCHYQMPNTHSSLIYAGCDEMDLALYETFLKAGKPILGICRGLQLIGVYHHVPLIQDLPTALAVDHNQDHFQIPANAFQHEVIFQKDTVIGSLFPQVYGVNSFHHQALSKVPDGFTLSAISNDGIIEAIEKENVLAVQWHPERLLQDEHHLALAKHFISLCQSK